MRSSGNFTGDPLLFRGALNDTIFVWPGRRGTKTKKIKKFWKFLESNLTFILFIISLRNRSLRAVLSRFSKLFR